MEVSGYEKCLRCNRILKSNKAKKRGYGDYCWHLHKLELKKRTKSALEKYLFKDKEIINE